MCDNTVSTMSDDAGDAQSLLVSSKKWVLRTPPPAQLCMLGHNSSLTHFLLSHSSLPVFPVPSCPLLIAGPFSFNVSHICSVI